MMPHSLVITLCLTVFEAFQPGDVPAALLLSTAPLAVVGRRRGRGADGRRISSGPKATVPTATGPGAAEVL